MISSIIEASMKNRVLILLLALILAAWGWLAVKQTPLDAIPDLSDVQVIVKTPFPGQTPQVVEDQITYPIASLMMSVPKAKVVRGYSFFGDSYIYILFKDGTDPYWARSRVLEYLSSVKGQLPAGVQPTLGPDASGVGWVYEYALKDPTHHLDLAQLRTLQDWFIKYELQAVPGVSEVASIGGFIKQYQVVVDPNKLRAYHLSLDKVKAAIQQSSASMGASVIEQGEAEYMVAVKGYVTKLSDLKNIPIGIKSSNETPLLLKDIARVQLGSQPRRGIAELNGQGEVVGGVVVMRSGENALKVIKAVKAKIAEILPGLPKGVEIETTYDRSSLINRAVETLSHKLIEEMVVVALISILFLAHFRSALVAIISLPLGVLGAFIIMKYMGISANIMSLGGIAIAIGAMVDAAIVMIENTHKHLEAYRQEHGHSPTGKMHWQVVMSATKEVGVPLFFSLLIIALSFVPIFALQEQAGRMFTPLALTKTLSMAVAAGLAITLVPVLLGYFVRGKLPDERKNPLNRFLIWVYQPILKHFLNWKTSVIFVFIALLITMVYPWQKMGSEFMPELEEGDLLYMPTTLPGLSIGAAQALLQQTDAMIKTFPEVKTVFGKIGRADTATDPAPLTMIETIIQLKPKSEWPKGMTLPKLIQKLNQRVKFPGLANAWVQPIKTRIDMLSTGIKTPIGIKVAGDDLTQIQTVGKAIEAAVQKLPEVTSAFSDRAKGGRYIDIVPLRDKAARYGLSVKQIANIASIAIGGKRVAQTLEGRERYSINLRYPQSWRDSVTKLKNLPIVTASGEEVQLGQIANIKVRLGPPMIKSENARLNGWVFVDLKPGTDLVGFVHKAQKMVDAKVKLPSGMSITWAGQYEYLQKAQETFKIVIPAAILIVLILLYLIFKDLAEAMIVMLVLPFAVMGSIWFVWALGYAFSIAIAVGIIALVGVAAEFGVVMLIYLKNAIQTAQENQQLNSKADLKAAIMKGAVLRVRPIAMTVSVIVLGLLPIMIGHGTGADVMKRIAAPMLGGMISAPLVSMILVPILTYLLYSFKLRRTLK